MIDQEFFARLRVLNEKFAAGVPATLARLGELRAQFDAHAPVQHHIDEFHQVLHTIAGSAGTFGFRTMGQQARTLEQRLRVLMAFQEVPAADWQHWLAALDEYTAWAALDPKSDDYPA